MPASVPAGADARYLIQPNKDLSRTSHAKAIANPRNRIITAIHVTAAGVTNEFLRLRDPLISLASIMQGVLHLVERQSRQWEPERGISINQRQGAL